MGVAIVTGASLALNNTKSKHWSCNFPDPATIVCLSRQPCIYILPDCYDDEELLFADSSEADFVEIVSAGASNDEL